MSRVDAGTAAADLRTTATPEGSGVRLTGEKSFASHSTDGERFLVYARFGPGVDGIGVTLVERGAPGFSSGRPVRYLSGEAWCSIRLDAVHVPGEQVLLRAGGFTAQGQHFEVERLAHTARAVALARHAFDAARGYVSERRQFGRSLCEFQGLQWSFADMHMRLAAARLLLYRAAAAADRGVLSSGDAAAAKAYGTVAAFDVCHGAMQAMGGLGYGEETLDAC